MLSARCCSLTCLPETECPIYHRDTTSKGIRSLAVSETRCVSTMCGTCNTGAPSIKLNGCSLSAGVFHRKPGVRPSLVACVLGTLACVVDRRLTTADPSFNSTGDHIEAEDTDPISDGIHTTVLPVAQSGVYTVVALPAAAWFLSRSSVLSRVVVLSAEGLSPGLLGCLYARATRVRT